ncbi:MAG: thiol reductant ABC exporter subunit CydD [Chloroflexi bacterium]|nr:thiol reductant ABC exporter subunit CydD [Chloroflexota bacterium]
MRPDSRIFTGAPDARRDLLLTVLAGAVGGVLLVGQAWLLSGAIDRLFLQSEPASALTGTFVALAAIIAARAALAYGSTLFAGRAASVIKRDLRERAFGHVAALGPAFTSAERSGEIATTLTEGIEALDTYIRDFLPRLALAAIIPLVLLLVVFPADLLTGLVLLLTAPLIPLFMYLIGSAAGAMARRRYGILSRMSAHFLDLLQGLTTLKLFGRARTQLDSIRVITDRFRGVTMEVLRVAFLSALVLELVGTLSTALVAVEIGVRLLAGGIPFRLAMFLLVLAPEFYLPLRALGASFHASTDGAAAIDRVYEILETPLPPAAAEHIAPPLRDAIRYEAVTFVYPGDRTALRDFSLHLGHGEVLALVGATGSGKSTAAALLLGFLRPTEGAILLDGRPLGDFSVASWREQIAWVPQRPYIFNTSVAENIRMARPAAPPAAVRKAAQQAAAHEFIMRLPQGYDTVVGERGTRLSGGQAQRIALARAFLKDAPILILDEATANLDPGTQARVQEAVEQLIADRTALLIAHRLETVQRADRILVMQNGRVVERGSHRELTGTDGAYSRLLAAGAVYG